MMFFSVKSMTVTGGYGYRIQPNKALHGQTYWMSESLANTNVEALTGIVPPWNMYSKPKHYLISIFQEQCVKLTFWLVFEIGPFLFRIVGPYFGF